MAVRIGPTPSVDRGRLAATYSIVARDPDTGELGAAAQSHYFAVGSEVPWAEEGVGVVVTQAFVNQAGLLNEATGTVGPFGVAEQSLGAYGEIAYDVLRLITETDQTLEPFYRYEYYDTQHRVPDGSVRDLAQQVQTHTWGLNIEPISNVVLKVDFRLRDSKRGSLSDELNLGVGYVF